MATKEENIILKHIAQEGSITRIDRETYGISLKVYCDIMGSLKLRGWIQTTEEVVTSESGRDMIIYKYTFTTLFEHQKHKYLKYIT